MGGGARGGGGDAVGAEARRDGQALDVAFFGACRVGSRVFVRARGLCSRGAPPKAEGADAGGDDSPLDARSPAANRYGDVFKTMSIARKHTFQILTKRADRMQEVVNDNLIGAYHLPNVWLGVTTENQEQFDKRVPYLIQTSAHVRFISVEPMLGPVSIERFAAHLDWVIIGGESGKRARPMQDEWVVDLILECNQYNVPVFFKQYGSVLAREYDLKDRSGADPSEWPVEWPQEFPVV